MNIKKEALGYTAMVGVTNIKLLDDKIFITEVQDRIIDALVKKWFEDNKSIYKKLQKNFTDEKIRDLLINTIAEKISDRVRAVYLGGDNE